MFLVRLLGRLALLLMGVGVMYLEAKSQAPMPATPGPGFLFGMVLIFAALIPWRRR